MALLFICDVLIYFRSHLRIYVHIPNINVYSIFYLHSIETMCGGKDISGGQNAGTTPISPNTAVAENIHLHYGRVSLNGSRLTPHDTTALYSYREPWKQCVPLKLYHRL